MTAAIDATRPHPLLSFPIGALGVAGKSIVTGDVYLAGWSIRETTGAAIATVQLFDGNDAGGVPVAEIGIAAGLSSNHSFGGHLLVCRNGLFVNVLAGAIAGSLWFADRLGVPAHQRRARE